MWVELGHFCLVLACVLSLFSGGVGLLGGIRQISSLLAPVRMASLLMTGLLCVSFVALTQAFLQDDFSVRYVAAHSNALLPVFYKVAAVWGGHEGSLLLWVVLLGVWIAAVALLAQELPNRIQVLVLAILALVTLGFLLFILLTSNPFERLNPIPELGTDLNPLLQDIGLVAHPPFLYLGYVGFSVAFAFAIAALITGQLDAAWAKFSRPWTIAAWVFLSIGIALGSAWAYYELGWGGWWFWDPVENASFMPWIAGTALIHSLAVAEKRGIFKHWTVLLAIVTFSLSLLGTFLVRSGVLTSVHAFATDPSRGTFILVFLALVVGSALSLYAWRAPTLGSRVQFTWLSREAALLVNNVLLITACAAVFIGTLFPLLMDTLGGGKFSVGAPYYNVLLTPLWLMLLFFLGVAPHLHWRKNHWSRFSRVTCACWGVSVVLGNLMPLVFGTWRWGVALALTIAWSAILVAVVDVVQRLRSTRNGQSLWQTLQSQPRAFLGMHLAHIGLAVFAIGATIVTAYEYEHDAVIMPKQTLALGDYQVYFQHLEGHTGPNYEALIGHFRIADDNGRVLAVLKPEKRQYFSGGEPMTEASIERRFLGDIYIALGEMQGSDRATSGWLIRLYSKPLMGWIWFGCLLMAVGGWLALNDKRYRQRKARA